MEEPGGEGDPQEIGGSLGHLRCRQSYQGATFPLPPSPTLFPLPFLPGWAGLCHHLIPHAGLPHGSRGLWVEAACSSNDLVGSKCLRPAACHFLRLPSWHGCPLDVGSPVQRQQGPCCTRGAIQSGRPAHAACKVATSAHCLHPAHSGATRRPSGKDHAVEAQAQVAALPGRNGRRDGKKVGAKE